MPTVSVLIIIKNNNILRLGYTHTHITIGSIALNIVPLVDSSILPNRYYFFRLNYKVCVKKPLQVSNRTITETSLFTA